MCPGSVGDLRELGLRPMRELFLWWFLLSVFHMACGDADSTSVSPAALEAGGGDTLNGGSQVRELQPGILYRLGWSGAPDSWKNHRTIVNDLGYELVFEEAFLGTYSYQLVPCPEETGWLDRFTLIGKAWAGHDSGPEDPSAYLAGYVEEIGAAQPVDVAQVMLESGVYCQAHYLAAETPETAPNLPSDVLMVSHTVHLKGVWSAPWKESTSVFQVRSDLANGMLLDLLDESGESVRVDLSTSNVAVTLWRDLGGLFDGMDMDVMEEEALAKVFLLNVVNGASVDVKTVPRF